ncbi:MAG: dihydrofolate reductase [Ignavibacteriales bacterium]|nr:dihydrofolate reductase [Ignavibacteriales bacterium]
MPNKVYIATSIDGFIAKKNGDINWLMDIPNPEGSDFGFNEFMNSVDAIVMGRITFEQVLKFSEWPYIKPVFVLSSTNISVPEFLNDKVNIIKGNPKSIIEKLNSMQYSNLYIDGGKTVQEFLKEDLIDELIITRIPILLGDGIPLFSKLINDQKYEHLATEIFNNTLVKSHYKRIRNK